MIKPTTQKNYTLTSLRLPPELHADILDSAKRNGRSMNAELIARLSHAPIEQTLEAIRAENNEIKMLAKQILGAIAPD